MLVALWNESIGQIKIFTWWWRTRVITTHSGGGHEYMHYAPNLMAIHLLRYFSMDQTFGRPRLKIKMFLEHNFSSGAQRTGSSQSTFGNNWWWFPLWHFPQKCFLYEEGLAIWWFASADNQNWPTVGYFVTLFILEVAVNANQWAMTSLWKY